LLSFAPRSEVLPQFLERSAEALRRLERAKPHHRVVPLFHPAMILLDSAVEESAAPMLDLIAEHFPNRTRIRVMPIAGHLPRSSVCNGESATEEALGRCHIPLRAEHGINQITLPVDSAVEVAPFPFDLYIRFIDVPAASGFSFTLAAELLSQQRCKPFFPLPHRFVTEFVAAHQKHADEVAQAELEQQSEDDDLKHDIGRKLKMIEGRTGAFVKPARASTTSEPGVSQIRCTIKLSGVIGPAMRARHKGPTNDTSRLCSAGTQS
jgi:hypothetical protein